MKRLPKKLSKKNKDSKIKKRTSCLYTSRCLPTRGGKNDDKSCIKRSKYADESKFERYEQEAPDRETLQEAVQQVKTWDGVIK